MKTHALVRGSPMKGSRGVRKVGVVAALSAFALLLAACNAAVSNNAGTDTATLQGVSSSEIKLGTSLPLTGGAAAGAHALLAGLQAAVGEANAQGGINGRKVSLKVLDDHFDAATFVANIQELQSRDQVYGILGPSGSANLPGAWPVAKRTGIPIFAPYLPPDPRLPSVFLLAPDHVDQAAVLAEYLAQHGAHKIGFIGQQNDLGSPVWSGVQKGAAAGGSQVTSPQWIQPNSTDVSSAVLDLKRQSPGAVVVGTDLNQTVVILKQVKALGWNVRVAGVDTGAGANTTSVTDPAGAAADSLMGTYTSEPATDSSSTISSFRTAVTKYADGGKTYVENSYSLLNYASTMLFFHILKGLGPNASDLAWKKFDAAAESIKKYSSGGVFAPVTFGALPGGHTGIHGSKVAEFEGGKWVPLTPNWLEPK
jgi:branched-chain amino acid transport system substrate-binding protein